MTALFFFFFNETLSNEVLFYFRVIIWPSYMECPILTMQLEKLSEYGDTVMKVDKNL